VNKDLIDITIVMDRSGSMISCQKDAEGGLNSFIEKQKAEPGKASVTLVQFDNYVDFVFKAKDVMEVKHINLQPRGGTALFDAIGSAIVSTGARLKSMSEEERPGGVIFVIVTDGEENSSTEYRAATIKSMIEHQQAKYNWQFTYLGANQDAITNAAIIGIGANAAATYTVQNMNAVFASVAHNTSAMRGDMSKGVAVSYSYSGDDRNDMVK
jgi:uncharacterized protein YegL